MPRLPFMKFNTRDWYAGTKTLNHLLKGYYIDLLCFIWEKGDTGHAHVDVFQLANLWSIPTAGVERKKKFSKIQRQVEEILSQLNSSNVISFSNISDAEPMYLIVQKRIAKEQTVLMQNAFRQNAFRGITQNVVPNNGGCNASSNARVTHKIRKIRKKGKEEEKKEEEKNIIPDKARNDIGTLPEQVTPTNPTLPTVTTAVAKPAHVQFVDNFKDTYESLSGQPFATTKLDFITAKRLIDAHGLEATVAKAKLLGNACQEGRVWFAKDGWGSFTIWQLSRHWNSLLEDTRPDPEVAKRQEFLKELKKAEEHRERHSPHR